MTLPTRSLSHDSSDLDVNSLMNNREFQEMLQDYFQSNTMTLDEFLENLPRFMMENYGTQDEEEVDSEFEEEDDEEIENIAVYLRRVGGSQFHAVSDPSENLFLSLLAGRRAAESSQEIPLRNILPQSPPPSPLPNRSRVGPPLPARPPSLRRVPSQLRRTTSSPVRIGFDPNAPDECKSPYNQLIDITSPPDRNNITTDLPMTREFMRRYGYNNGRIDNTETVNFPSLIDEPER